MRVLVLASYIPSPFKGAEIRLMHLLRHLARRHEVTLWAINRRGTPAEEVAELVPGCRLLLQNPGPSAQGKRGAIEHRLARFRPAAVRLASLFSQMPEAVNQIWRRPLANNLRRLLAEETFDLIHINQIMVWCYLPADISAPVLLCKDNAWASLAWQDYAAHKGAFGRWRAGREATKMSRYERSAVEASAHSVVVSEDDGRRIEELAPGAAISIVPNGVDTAYFQPSDQEPEARRLVFTGSMGWRPNAEGVIWFCRDVLPQVRVDFPDVQFSIVGLHPPPEVRRLAEIPGVEVTGFVPDVRPYMAQAAVYVTPLRMGSGTRLKILEALAMGKATVSTALGAEGLAVEDGRHLLLADDAPAFAARVCDLLADPGLGRRLAKAGRLLVQEQYDWSAIAGQLDAIYRRVAGQTEPSVSA